MIRHHRIGEKKPSRGKSPRGFQYQTGLFEKIKGVQPASIANQVKNARAKPRFSSQRSLDPGTKEMGFAIFQGHMLIDHGVKVIKKGRSPQETLTRGMAIVAGLIQDFRPELLSIEKVFIGRNRNAALLNIFVDEIKLLAKRSELQVLSFAPNVVKKAICGYGWATKAEVAKAVAVRYPELKAYLFKDRKWKERFHANMFDAVALGMMVTG